MTMRYLHHVTLTTGHHRRSWCGEVDDAAVAATRELLADAVASGAPVPLPVPGDYRLAIEPFGERRAALATVSAGATPIALIGVARKPAPALWDALLVEAGRAGVEVLASVPEAPWCAALLLPAASDRLDAMGWLGDFERCLAWAWIE